MERRSDEERRFNVLLERVEGQYNLLSEKVMSLDHKIDSGLQEVREDMDKGFVMIQSGIHSIMREVQNHKH